MNCLKHLNWMISESERFWNQKVNGQKTEIERSFGFRVDGLKMIKRTVWRVKTRWSFRSIPVFMKVDGKLQKWTAIKTRLETHFQVKLAVQFGSKSSTVFPMDRPLWTKVDDQLLNWTTNSIFIENGTSRFETKMWNWHFLTKTKMVYLNPKILLF